MTDASAPSPRFGLSAALATPFDASLAIDVGRARAHVVDLLARGCASVTLFGTTGEGASIGARERALLHEGLLAAGIAPERMIVTILACDLEGAQAQGREALGRGAGGLLATPPFYFAAPDEDALHAWYARFFESVGAQMPRVVLYHIPQVTGVPLSARLVARLKREFGPLVHGVKDSSGSRESAEAFLEIEDLCVLVGDERLLAGAVAKGAAGAISGMANLVPERLDALIRRASPDPVLDALVDAVCEWPVVPTIKSLLAETTGEEGWARVRPPLSVLGSEAGERIRAAWRACGAQPI